MEQIPSNMDATKNVEQKMSKEEYVKKLKSDEPLKGTVEVVKPSKIKKLMEYFIPGDIQNVKEYLVQDLIIPTTKDAILNTISMFLYGDVRKPSGVVRSSGPKVSYRGYFTQGGPQTQQRQVIETKSSEFKYNDLEFTYKESAARVYNSMVQIVDAYGMVSIADMYELALNEGESRVTPPYTYHDFGWKSLADVPNIISVRSRTHDGMVWIIDMPKAIPIK